MQLRCSWEQAPAPGRCAVGDCSREARLFCREHFSEGLFCTRHRRIHSQAVAKKNAELDSRPRDVAPTPKPIERFVNTLAAVTGRQILGGSPLV